MITYKKNKTKKAINLIEAKVVLDAYVHMFMDTSTKGSKKKLVSVSAISSSTRTRSYIKVFYRVQTAQYMNPRSLGKWL